METSWRLRQGYNDFFFFLSRSGYDYSCPDENYNVVIPLNELIVLRREHGPILLSMRIPELEEYTRNTKNNKIYLTLYACVLSYKF